MTPKLILALIDGGPLSHPTLEAAFLVAKQFDAQLEVLHVRADPATMISIVGGGMSGPAIVEQGMETMTKVVEVRAQRARAAFDRIAAKGAQRLRGAKKPGLSRWFLLERHVCRI